MNKAILAAISSAIVWGSGQALFAKQYLKGLFLFIIQLSIISIELFTGYWVEALMGLVPVFDIRVHGGFFSKGLWGIITLGTVPRQDHSIQLLIMGVITILLLLVIFLIAIMIIKDKRTSSSSSLHDSLPGQSFTDAGVQWQPVSVYARAQEEVKSEE